MFSKKYISRVTGALLVSVMILSAMPVNGANDVLSESLLSGGTRTNAYSPLTADYMSLSEPVTGDSGGTDKGRNETTPQDKHEPAHALTEEKADGQTVPETSDTHAQRFIPITPGNTVQDSLQYQNSENIYIFDVTERGSVIFAFMQTGTASSDCRWKITLFQQFNTLGISGETMYRELYTLYAGTDKVQSMPTGVLPGHYRLAVTCVSGWQGDSYAVAVQVSQNDSYEAECNDTLTRYNELPLNKDVKGCCAPLADGLDADCYMFEITEAGCLNFVFVHDDMESTEAAYRLYIYDTNGNEYFFARSLFSDIIITSGNISLEPGYYFVEVDSHIFCECEYMLTVQFTTDPTFETELNDTKQTANTLTTGIETYGNITARSEITDRDWYTFTLDEDGSVLVDFIHNDLERDRDGWRIVLSDENGNIYYSAISKWNDNVVQSPFIGLSAGRYYICIDSEGLLHSAATYALLVVPAGTGMWETEPNDTHEKANVISLDMNVNGTMVDNGIEFDKDFYAVTVTEKSDIVLRFAHSAADYDREGWIITLYDASMNPVLSFTSNWNTEITESDEKELEAGTYYICVETGLYYSHMRYELTAVRDAQKDIDIGV